MDFGHVDLDWDPSHIALVNHVAVVNQVAHHLLSTLS